MPNPSFSTSTLVSGTSNNPNQYLGAPTPSLITDWRDYGKDGDFSAGALDTASSDYADLSAMITAGRPVIDCGTIATGVMLRMMTKALYTYSSGDVIVRLCGIDANGTITPLRNRAGNIDVTLSRTPVARVLHGAELDTDGGYYMYMDCSIDLQYWDLLGHRYFIIQKRGVITYTSGSAKLQYKLIA